MNKAELTRELMDTWEPRVRLCNQRVALELALADMYERALKEAAAWFEVRDFSRSNVEYGFRKSCAAELRVLAVSGKEEI